MAITISYDIKLKNIELFEFKLRLLLMIGLNIGLEKYYELFIDELIDEHLEIKRL